MIKEFLIVGIGGFFGCGGRYVVSKIISGCFSSLPIAGTFAVNVIGCFAFGLIAGLAEKHTHLPQAISLLLITGFCGGFTTFSTFANELFVTYNGKQWLMLIAYLTISIILGVAMVVGGRLLALKL